MTVYSVVGEGVGEVTWTNKNLIGTKEKGSYFLILVNVKGGLDCSTFDVFKPFSIFCSSASIIVWNATALVAK